ARIRDQLLIGGRERDLAVLLLECLIDLPDFERDVLRLAQKLLRPLHVLLKLLEGGIWQAGEVAGLIDEHLRFVLKGGDLIVDLLERTRGGQNVLRIIRRVIDDAPEPELGIGWARYDGRKRDRHGERKRHGRPPGETGDGDTDHGLVSFSGAPASAAGSVNSGGSARFVRSGMRS